MNVFGVSEEKAEALAARLAKLGVKEEDLEESFIRATGPGGQHVNKVSTCVRLRHAPSGSDVRAQDERSQALNRYRARIRLAEKLEQAIDGHKSAQQQLREKIRRQKRQRSRRAKKKMVDNNRRLAKKKNLRRKPGEDD